MKHFEIAYREKLPPQKAYQLLFETTGWNKVNQASPQELSQAITGSWCVLSAYDNDDLVGFDGGVSLRAGCHSGF